MKKITTYIMSMLLVLCLTAAHTVLAQSDFSYVSDVVVVADEHEAPNDYTTKYTSQGYTLCSYDLNAGAGGAYVYLLYKTSNSNNPNGGYVADFVIKKTAISTITIDSDGTNAVSGTDLNKGAGGDYIYMHVTTAKLPVPYAELSSDGTTLTFKYGEKPSIGTVYDLNTGTSNPDWMTDENRTKVTAVVFDESFKNAKPTSCYAWFSDFSEIKTITDIQYLNTSEVTNMRYMFPNCVGLTALDLSSFNTASVTDMGYMFNGCRFTSINLSSFNTEMVTDMENMFYDCNKLETIDLSSFNTESVTTMGWMFYTCSELKTIKVGSGWNTDAVGNSEDMFYGCSSLVGGSGTTYDENKTDKTYARIDGGTSNPGYLTISGTPYAELSEDGTTLTFKYGVKPDGAYSLNTGTVSPAWEGMGSTITKVVFDESFQYARPTSCVRWFNGFTNIETITDIQYLNTEEVTNMYLMFRSCTNLKTLDLSNFNTEKVADMQFMFYGCNNLTVLDIRTFDTQNVEDMTDMFTSCSNLKTILISYKWNTGKVTADKSKGMFRYCSSLVGNDGTKVSSVDVTNAHADAGGYLTKDDYKIFYKWADDKMGAYQTQFTPSTFSGETDVTINNPTDREYEFLYWTQVSVKGAQIGSSSTNLTIAKGDLGNKIYVMHWRIPQPYAELSTDSKTLTFKYGFKPDGAYELYEGETTNPGWYDNRTNITKVVFDETFAEARPTSCYCWFKEFENLEGFDGIENFNTSEVTTMRSMFDKCKKLENVDLSHFDTRKLKSMRSMFYDCIKLKTLDLSSFNTESVESMRFVFTNCSTLTCINIRNFNPKNVSDMSGMFSECKELTTILIGSEWKQENISSVTSSQNMFVNCNEIIGNDGTTFDTDVMDITNAHADAGGYLTKDDYKIFYKWADDETGAYKTQYTPSTYNSSITPLTIDPPDDREGYKFLYWTRVSAGGTQIGSSSATLTIAESEVGNRIYQMHWTIKQYAINLPEGFKAYAEDDLDTPIESAPAGKKIIIKYEGTKPVKKLEVVKEE